MDRELLHKLVCALLAVLAAIAFFVGFWWFYIVRLKAVLRAWQAEGGFQIVSFKKRNLTLRGPFRWGTVSRNQVVYHVRVRYRDGRERTGWVRLGSFLGGVLLSTKADAIWEDE
jgi:hypothetical protein